MIAFTLGLLNLVGETNSSHPNATYSCKVFAGLCVKLVSNIVGVNLVVLFGLCGRQVELRTVQIIARFGVIEGQAICDAASYFKTRSGFLCSFCLLTIVDAEVNTLAGDSVAAFGYLHDTELAITAIRAAKVTAPDTAIDSTVAATAVPLQGDNTCIWQVSGILSLCCTAPNEGKKCECKEFKISHLT